MCRILISLFILCACASSVIAAEANQEAERRVLAAAERFSERASQVSALSRHLDRADFELSSAVDRLDYDEEAIIEFVSTKIALDPYFGQLRGPQGALSARAGNPLDQSGLLVALLTLAGLDAQVLEIDSIPKELEQALAHSALGSPPADLNAQQSLHALLLDIGLPEDQARSMSRLEPTPIAPKVSAVSAVLEAQLTQLNSRPWQLDRYHWVRYRMAPGMPWQYAHPALAEQTSIALDADRVIHEVGQDQFHALRFELEAELLENGQLRREPMMSTLHRPVARLIDRPLRIGIMASDTPDQAGNGTSIRAMINDDLAPGARLFTLTGASIDAGLLRMSGQADGMSSLIMTLGDQVQDSAQAIAQTPDDQPLRALTGVILRVHWEQPGHAARTEERWLLDRLVNRDAADEPPRIDTDMDAASIVRALNGQREFLISPGGRHASWMLQQLLESLAVRAEWTASVLRAVDFEAGILPASRIGPLDASQSPMLVGLQQMTEVPMDLPDGHRLFRNGPLLISHHRFADPEHQPRGYTDILFNPWVGIRKQDGVLKSWPGGGLLRGVFDTGMEVLITAQTAADGDYLQHTRADGVELITEPDAVSGWSQADRLAARHDLAQGFSVLAVTDQQQERLWWRISADGQEVLGRSALGGSAAEEGMTLGIILNSLSVLLTTVAIGNCTDTFRGQGLAMACCITVNAAIGAGGIAGGSLAGGRVAQEFGEAAPLGVAILDMLGFTVTSVAGVGLGHIIDSACDNL